MRCVSRLLRVGFGTYTPQKAKESQSMETYKPRSSQLRQSPKISGQHATFRGPLNLTMT